MVLLSYFYILIRKNIVLITKHCLSSEKLTCRPLDKGQKSTRCTSLRKPLGIFTVTMMMYNTNKDCSPNPPSLSHLVSSVPGGATAVFSSIHRAKILIYTYFIAMCFRLGMQSAVRWKNIPCFWSYCSTQGHARTRCIQRRASSRHHPRATMCDTAKDALKNSSDICALQRPMFDSKGLIVPNISANRLDEDVGGAEMKITDDQLKIRPLCDSTKRLKGEDTLIYATDRKQTPTVPLNVTDYSRI